MQFSLRSKIPPVQHTREKQQDCTPLSPPLSAVLGQCLFYPWPWKARLATVTEGLWSPAGGWPFLAAARHHQPLPAAPGAAARQARPLKASHASSPMALSLTSRKQSFGPASDIHPWGGKIQTCRPRGALDGSVGEHSQGHSQAQCALSNQSGQRLGARWGTSNPSVCSRICPVQNTAKSSIQSPDDVSVFAPRYKEMMKFLLPSGEWGWALTAAAQWRAATAQLCAYCPASGQRHRLF